MTRELKLALIVGFALVLLVTVLISDHLSKARKAQVAGNVTDAPTGVLTTPNEPAQGPVVTINQGSGGGIVSQPPPVMVGPGPGDNSSLALQNPGSDPTIQNVIGTRVGEPVPAMPPMVSTDRANIANGLHTDNAALGNQLGGTPGAGQTPDSAAMNETKPMLLPGFDSAKQQPISSLDKANPTPAITTPAEEAKAPATKADERWHTVAAGDSAYSIAKQYYGKGEYWPKLKEANGDRMGEKGQLRVGVRVRIPDPASIGLKGVDPSKAPKSASDSVSKPKETRVAKYIPAKPTGPRSYVVQKGDTLGTISQKQLGSSKRIGDILKANKDIRNPNALRVGSTIKLPAA